MTHEIRSTHDEVDFQIHAHNPTDTRSDAHWAQPCIRLDRFTGCDQTSYLAKGFVFLDDELTMMPTPRWSTEARYVPGQVWAAPGVDRRDVNPRPLHPDVPSNGLIGCYSADDSMLFATAFEPYQELFQGVIVCLHSDFRLGDLNSARVSTFEARSTSCRVMSMLCSQDTQPTFRSIFALLAMLNGQAGSDHNEMVGSTDSSPLPCGRPN